MRKSVLRAYARLIARSGVNIQKGQEVFIAADLDQPEFVAMLVDECYKCKAKKVVVDWNYQPLQKLHVRHRSLTTLSRVEDYELARWQHYVDTIPCRIYLLSEDPDGLKGIDQTKLAKSQQAKFPIIKPYRDKIENRYQWCIAAVPGEAWAKKLFPGLRRSQAVEKLWEAILSTSRALEGDPVANWDAHNADIHSRCDYLNSLHIRQLRYKSATGTDFTVGMIPQAHFCGGSEKSLQGIVFNPNIPTEECFISPKRGEAEGIVYATKPLSYQGQLIDGFWIRFHEGKAVEWHAEQNADQAHHHGRGQRLSGRVRAGALRQSHPAVRPAVLQHAVRRKRRLPSGAGHGLCRHHQRFREQDAGGVPRAGRQRLHDPRGFHDRLGGYGH